MRVEVGSSNGNNNSSRLQVFLISIHLSIHKVVISRTRPTRAAEDTKITDVCYSSFFSAIMSSFVTIVSSLIKGIKYYTAVYRSFTLRRLALPSGSEMAHVHIRYIRGKGHECRAVVQGTLLLRYIRREPAISGSYAVLFCV